MNLHRLRLSAWSERVYLKYHRPHRTFFGYIPGFGPQECAKSAIWRRFSIDFCRIRAPMRGHRKMACFSHISPHGRSKLDAAIGKQSRRSIDAKRSLSECSMDHPSTASKEQGALGSHFHGVGGHRRRRCPWRFWRSPGAPNQGSTQKTYKMVGEILDTHLLATLTRAVYANSPSQWVKSVITRYFFRTPYLLCISGYPAGCC